MGKEKQLKITIFRDAQLKVNGIFDLFRVREAIAGAISARKYFMFEKANSVREMPEGKEYEMEFAAFKKVDDYVKFSITVKFLIQNFNEVESEGKILGSGIATISFTSEMEKDWKKRFGGTGFKNLVREVYEKYVVPEKLLKREVELYNEAKDIMNEAKSVLEMYQ